MNRKIKVLVIDDSAVFREFLARGLSADPELQVVARAENPYDAVDKIERFQPDVITCDIEMPKMDGIEFVRQLLPQHPVPIIVVSSVGRAVFDALSAGAVDFVTKPDLVSGDRIEVFMRTLVQKVKEVSRAKVVRAGGSGMGGDERQDCSERGIRSDRGAAAAQPLKPLADMSTVMNSNFNLNLIAIGASTGGTESIYQLLKQLPPEMPGIVIVQHIPPSFSRLFAERLNAQTQFEVVEGKSGDLVAPGKVIIAPGDHHMIVKRMGERFKVEVYKGEKVNGHCPSVDVLFESVAKSCGAQALGVILTGMGYDGAKGLLGMRRRGAVTIGQDEASSVVYGMPKAAFEVGAVERQLPLSQMPAALSRMVR
ncbi:protein-glutamate methylesterase/protein-glutamine glutaminase [Acidaminobacter hydrogenoformans]|uniref:Protein-glutamate methylesterase/protein-glutamine glutaminase n=1 Tax=Acidaminobacter hydrogenoformans DSM 2784 TaxID=1120920 RepID=A0A1G5RVF3_9FIRM|nr:chemotaxis response regulator protein-glutamate methylesterase [Acidaminobacter hydrogenoformans]SCZ77838.1 two-component system, chemotaxis family, response regulator CheB [Acidaminobacter hydrogenoformans DSM 2784]